MLLEPIGAQYGKNDVAILVTCHGSDPSTPRYPRCVLVARYPILIRTTQDDILIRSMLIMVEPVMRHR